ncbi:uncharacterized protein LOC120118374 [Hibiscus syriacus]|uniref:uncharacterized protein LOC120118374 n=1 Tax=Hibiscus syriacus TaxID=106335 RepID=UPI001923D496|nr:uncharacterized protein LOC120118374 [Hibiscus syriacus]
MTVLIILFLASASTPFMIAHKKASLTRLKSGAERVSVSIDIFNQGFSCEAYSTSILPLDILAERPPEQKLEWAKRLLAQYGNQISVVSIVVLFIYLIATPSKSSAAKASKKR